MNNLIRVADILYKYYPSASILNNVPNFKYNSYYIIHDRLIGPITSEFKDKFKEKYSHLDEHVREDILAMNIHHSFYDMYSEKDIANYFHTLINDLPNYSHYHINH